MANFCGKCGTRLDESTGKCPQCDRSLFRNGHQRSKKLGWFLMIAAMIGLALGITFLLYVVSPPNCFEEKVETTEAQAYQQEMELPRAESVDYIEAYTRIVHEIQNDAQSSNNSVGQLYDMDADGIPELCVSYLASITETVIFDNGETYERIAPYIVCDMYTFKNGNAIKLVDQEKLYIQAEGCYGAFAFAEIDGETYLVLCGEAGTSSPDENDSFYTDGFWKFFVLDDDQLICNSIEYSYCYLLEDGNHIVLQKDFQAVSNGEKITFENYVEQTKFLNKLNWVDCFSGTPLTELIDQRKMHAIPIH